MSLVAPTRVLVLGGAGREHALAWKLAGEPGVNEIVVAPGSAAISSEARVRSVVGIDPLDPDGVVACARAEAAELVVIGPEAPLAVGVADALRAAGIAVFGPDRAAARIETSKAFCHKVAEAAGVRMARAAAFGPGDDDEALSFVREIGADGQGVVLKADGLAAGKGVIVCDDAESAAGYVPSFLAAGRGAGRAPGPALVVEERLEGREASVIAICDGERAVALPAARDHKRLCEGDAGPNTGGMGAYSPLPDLDDAAIERIVETIHLPILAELARRGAPFRGFLYAGLMLTADGPALLECNARLGDPEAQAILPRVAAPVGPLLLAAARGRLPDVAGPNLRLGRLPVFDGAAVAVVLAAKGYPGTARRGDPISGLEAATDSGALVFHAGTVGRPGGGYGTSGGRVLTVVGRGRDVASAREAAERAADLISFDGLQRRRDIGADAVAAASGAGA